MVTKYLDENTFFYFRARFDDVYGDLDNWYMDRFYVQMQLPWDVTFTVGRQYSDWEGDAGLYRALVGDNEGGVWKDQKYDGFNFKKSFGMLDAELLVGRNFNILDTTYGSNSKGDNNDWMEYGLKLQANFSENFYAGVQGILFDNDGDMVFNGTQVVVDDIQQYGAYLSYSFTRR